MPISIESEFLRLIADICVGGASLGCLYLLVACVAVLRFPKRRPPPAPRPVPVTVLKPLCGVEPGLPARLRAFCTQRYGAPVQLVCGTAERADPAAEIAKEAGNVTGHDEAGSAVSVAIDGRHHGSNHKVSNLVNMLPLARHDVLVVSDSDIEVGPDYLATITAYLHASGVGAVTCLYHGVPAGGIWASQAALAINSHFLPNVVTAVSFGLAQPCFGSTIALRRDTLWRIGGFKAFADCLADDYEIGKAVRATGAEVVVGPFSLGHVCFQHSFRTLLTDEMRAARTIRSIDPIGYCGAILSHPFPLALLAVLLGDGDALLLAALALACRAVLCLCVEHAFAVPRQPYWLVPASELISFAAFASSFLCGTVTWRGICQRVSSDGRLMASE